MQTSGHTGRKRGRPPLPKGPFFHEGPTGPLPWGMWPANENKLGEAYCRKFLECDRRTALIRGWIVPRPGAPTSRRLPRSFARRPN